MCPRVLRTILQREFSNRFLWELVSSHTYRILALSLLDHQSGPSETVNYRIDLQTAYNALT